MKADAATTGIQLDAETRRLAEQSVAQAQQAVAQAEKALAQRDEARLRVNLMCMAMGVARYYPVPDEQADLVRAVSARLEPVR